MGALVLGLVGCGPEPEPEPAPEATAPHPSPPQPSVSTEPEPGAPVRLAFTPDRYDGWLNRIPDGLPLAAGLPRPDGDVERSHAPVSLQACGREALGKRDAVDSRSVTATGPEFADQHALLLFADDRAAAGYLDRALTRVQGCPTETHGTTTWSLSVRPGRSGFLALRTYADGGQVVPGADWWEVSRTGNVVLVTGMGGEYLPDTVRQGIRQHRARLRPLVRSLCAFAPGGCPVDEPDVAEDFPLAAGYPGRRGRRRTRIRPGRSLTSPAAGRLPALRRPLAPAEPEGRPRCVVEQRRGLP